MDVAIWAPNRYNLSWGRKDMCTFIQVRPGTDIKALEAKFPAIVTKYNPALKERNQNDVLVAISTVSFQTMKAARINPLDSLRHE